MPQTIERLHVSVAGAVYALAPLETVDDLKGAIIGAVRAGGGFVDLALDDGQRLSVLVGPTSSIVIAAQTITLHPRSADGSTCPSSDAAAPFDYDSDWPFDLM